MQIAYNMYVKNCKGVVFMASTNFSVRMDSEIKKQCDTKI